MYVQPDFEVLYHLKPQVGVPRTSALEYIAHIYCTDEIVNDSSIQSLYLITTKTPQAYLMYLMYLMQKLYHRVLSFESGKTHFSRFFHVFDSPNGEKRSSWGADFGVIGKPIAIFLIAVYCSHFDISVSTKHCEKTRF